MQTAAVGAAQAVAAEVKAAQMGAAQVGAAAIIVAVVLLLYRKNNSCPCLTPFSGKNIGNVVLDIDDTVDASKDFGIRSVQH